MAVPESIERVFCSNPIGTVDIYLLDPDLLVGWNFRPTGDNRKYIPEVYLNLPTLGVWMGSGATPNDEEIVRQSPQAILCYWTADDVGRSMADDVRDETGVPTLLIDYDIRQCAEMYRYVGGCSRARSAPRSWRPTAPRSWPTSASARRRFPQRRARASTSRREWGGCPPILWAACT